MRGDPYFVKSLKHIDSVMQEPTTTHSRFLHNTDDMSYIKLVPLPKEKQSTGFRQIGAKSALFRPVWPWNLTDDLEKE